jgi:3'(2'), 5'-bisphosphate nucleotidase
MRTPDLSGALPLKARAPGEHLLALWSRTHDLHRADEYRALYRVSAVRALGSSLKFCLIAAGEADLYPRHGPTMEWDTAAGQAVLEAAGGSVRGLDGAPLRYGKTTEGYRNPSFVARGR